MARADHPPAALRFPLTPSQHWFFDQPLVDRNRFNLAVLIKSRLRLDRALVEDVLCLLVRRHDALRLRFIQNGDCWIQYAEELPRGPYCSTFDFSGLNDLDRQEAIEFAASRLHSGLSLAEGPLIRAGLFNLGWGTPQLLLIVVHHIAVDILSCHILIREFLAACESLCAGVQSPEGEPPGSFRHWTESLATYAQSSALRAEVSYWLGPRWRDVAPITRNRGAVANLVGTASRVSMALSERDSQALLAGAARSCRVQPSVVVLTALEDALTRWVGTQPVLVDIEAHGREDLFADPALLRTVGWFTAAYPMRLKPRIEQNAAAAIEAVRDRINEVPNGGIGYGLLKYLSSDSKVVTELRAQARPEIGFNYVASPRGSPGISSSWFEFLGDSPGEAQSPNNPRVYAIDLLAFSENGKLRLDWTYCRSLHSANEITALGNACLESLRRLILPC